MKHMTVYNLTASTLGAVLAVGCAGTAVSEKPNEMPVASNPTPVMSAPVGKPGGEPKAAVQVAQAEQTQGTAAAQQKFPYIALPDDIKPKQRTFHFGFDKAEVEDADRAVLKKHAEYLQDHPETILQIQGHTDHHGPKAYNEYLSKKRAEAIAKILIEYGAPESQLVIDALADSQPLRDVTRTARNRRVELDYKVLEMVHSD